MPSPRCSKPLVVFLHCYTTLFPTCLLGLPRRAFGSRRLAINGLEFGHCLAPLSLELESSIRAPFERNEELDGTDKMGSSGSE